MAASSPALLWLVGLVLLLVPAACFAGATHANDTWMQVGLAFRLFHAQHRQTFCCDGWLQLRLRRYRGLTVIRLHVAP